MGGCGAVPSLKMSSLHPPCACRAKRRGGRSLAWGAPAGQGEETPVRWALEEAEAGEGALAPAIMHQPAMQCVLSPAGHMLPPLLALPTLKRCAARSASSSRSATDCRGGTGNHVHTG